MLRHDPEAFFSAARKSYHALLRDTVFRLDKGVLSNADTANKTSRDIALGTFQRFGIEAIVGPKLAGQTAGNEFEKATALFVRETFLKLSHLRPGDWTVRKIGAKDIDGGPRQVIEKGLDIAQFEQYRHLVALAKAAAENPDLAATLGNDYIIKPDIVVFRSLEDDAAINKNEPLVDSSVATLASLRKQNGGSPVLHASISCKLTIRSDSSQNSRSEALNLIRNRRGKLPHVVIVTAEPLPSRLASVALGSGDIDCVYHYALTELRQTVRELALGDSEELLEIMVGGKRLKDISDLPLDLAV